MAATPTLISVEEYLHTRYRPDCDYVDGELQERNVGEYSHGKLQAWLIFWFMTRAQEWGIDPIPEQRINISATRYRVCDVTLLSIDAPREEIIVTPPLLCIEIMSPEDRISRATRVLEDYRSMGIPLSWLIDPIRREAFVFDDKGLRAVETDRLEIPNSPIHLILSDLFAALDRK